MKYSAKLLTTLLVLIFTCSALSAAAPEGDSLKTKLKKIKDADKIVIYSDGKEIVLDKDEANKFLRKVKKGEHIVWHTDENGDEKTFKIVIGDDHDGKIKVHEFFSDDDEFVFFSGDEHDLTTQIEIEEVDGEKKVTVKVLEDGEKSVKEYTGEEAEEYLKKLEEEENIWISETHNGHSFDFEYDTDADMDIKVDVKIDEGDMKVEVTETKDGKTSTKTYEGDEAKGYLKKHRSKSFKLHGKGVSSKSKVMIITDDGDKKVKELKKIIIKKEKKEKEED